ncbi:MAG: hypothetical protein VXY77_04050 [Pseudomonadota bacterium]|nr:hypothetical protein [Pseudomonadota bacterium]
MWFYLGFGCTLASAVWIAHRNKHKIQTLCTAEFREKQLDPPVTVANQFFRLFAGKILDQFIGDKKALRVKPVIKILGNLLVLMRSMLSLTAKPDKGIIGKQGVFIEQDLHDKDRILYMTLIYAVLSVSVFSLCKTLCGQSGDLLGIPSSLIGGALNLAAEVLEQWRRAGVFWYYANKFTHKPQQSGYQDQINIVISKKQSLARKRVSNLVTFSISLISWANYLFTIPPTYLPFMGMLGMGITLANLYQTSIIPIRLFHEPPRSDMSSELKACESNRLKEKSSIYSSLGRLFSRTLRVISDSIITLLRTVLDKKQIQSTSQEKTFAKTPDYRDTVIRTDINWLKQHPYTQLDIAPRKSSAVLRQHSLWSHCKRNLNILYVQSVLALS